jgi:hypothetical protein
MQRRRYRWLVGAVTCGAILSGCGGGTHSSSSAKSNAPAAQSAPRPTATATTTTGARASKSSRPDKKHIAKKPHEVGAAPSSPAASPSAEPRKPEEELGKTPFRRAAGLGFAAFHTYISKPLRRGELHQGGSHAVIAKAATAAAYAASQITTASSAATAIKLPQAVIAKLEAVQKRLKLIEASLKAGQVPAEEIVAARPEVSSVELASYAAGESIEEVTPALP